MARKPDFIIIGSQRCGTTSMYNCLITHPDVMGFGNNEVRDEPHFFDNYRRFMTNGLDWYFSNFSHDYKVVGEKSPTYLQHYDVPRRIKRSCPDTKFIVMVRNPIDRAYSNYWKAIGKGFIKRDSKFEDFVFSEDDVLKRESEHKKMWTTKFWGSKHHVHGLLERGKYAKHLKRWFEFFDKEQFIVIKSESFFRRPRYYANEVYNFLGLDGFRPPTRIQNRGRGYPKMDSKTREWLVSYFAPHNLELEELLGRKFHWA